jgi:phage shock protein A
MNGRPDPVGTPIPPPLPGTTDDGTPPPVPGVEVRVVDAEDLARLAAETVALIEHHRTELQATMAELTALQRAVRSELRATLVEVRELADRLDPAGVAVPTDG